MQFYSVELGSRLLMGTSQYPSPAVLADAVRAAGAEIVTVSLRREAARLREGQDFWGLIRDLGVRVLPNTAGCHSVKEALTTAHMAREVFGTPWIKLEVIGEDDTLQPDVFALTEAAQILAGDSTTSSACGHCALTFRKYPSSSMPAWGYRRTPHRRWSSAAMRC